MESHVRAEQRDTNDPFQVSFRFGLGFLAQAGGAPWCGISYPLPLSSLPPPAPPVSLREVQSFS